MVWKTEPVDFASDVGGPLTEKDLSSDKYEEGVSCPKCRDHLTNEKMESLRERHRQVLLSEARNRSHIGQKIE